MELISLFCGLVARSVGILATARDCVCSTDSVVAAVDFARVDFDNDCDNDCPVEFDHDCPVRIDRPKPIQTHP
jgi:hypothetical protein